MEPANQPDGIGSPALKESLLRSAAQLRERMDEHRRLLEMSVRSEGGGTFDPCQAVGCFGRQYLRDAIAEAIEVLDATRKAFKSKQVEDLRKKLIRVLAEEA